MAAMLFSLESNILATWRCRTAPHGDPGKDREYILAREDTYAIDTGVPESTEGATLRVRVRVRVGVRVGVRVHFFGFGFGVPEPTEGASLR